MQSIDLKETLEILCFFKMEETCLNGDGKEPEEKKFEDPKEQREMGGNGCKADMKGWALGRRSASDGTADGQGYGGR